MSKTIRMEEEDSNKITIPPLSIDEEGEEVIVDLNEAAGSEEKAPQEEVAESVDSTIKSIKPTEGLEKGVLQEDLFNTLIVVFSAKLKPLLQQRKTLA